MEEKAASGSLDGRQVYLSPSLLLFTLGGLLGCGTLLLGWDGCALGWTLLLGLGSTWILGFRCTRLLTFDRGWLTGLLVIWGRHCCCWKDMAAGIGEPEARARPQRFG